MIWKFYLFWFLNVHRKKLAICFKRRWNKKKKSTIINSYKFTFSRIFSMHTQDRFCIMFQVYNLFQCIKKRHRWNELLDGFYFSISQHSVLTFLSFSVEFLDVRWISFILNIAWTSEYRVDRSLLPWYVINSFKSHYFLCKLHNHCNTYWTMKGTFISTIE